MVYPGLLRGFTDIIYCGYVKNFIQFVKTQAIAIKSAIGPERDHTHTAWQINKKQEKAAKIQ